MVLVWLNGSPSTPPAFLELRSNKYFIVLTISAAVFTDLFLYGIVVPVFPFALTTRSGVAPESVQTWISTLLAVYGAALLAASPVCGYFADRTESRKMPLLFGLLALAGATVMLTVGNSIAVLVVGRILQGVSAAVVWVVGLALLVDTVGSQDIGQCMGYIGLAMSLAILVAPLLGGLVFDRAGYYAVFAMAFGLLGVDIVLRLALIEKKVALQWRTETVVVDSGAEAAGKKSLGDDKESQGIALESMDAQHIKPGHDIQANQGDAPQNHSTEQASGLEVATPDLPEKTRLPPLLLLLSSRRLVAALWGCLIQAALLTSFDSTLPLFVRKIFGWNSIGAGLIFLPLVMASFIGPVVGWFADKYGPRWPATIGFICAMPCLVLLRLVTHDSIGQKVLLCALLALLGVTLTIVLTPLMAEITYAVEATTLKRPKGFFGKQGAYAQAYGLFNMAFAGGCLVGPLVGGLVNQRAGWGATTLTLGCLSIVTAVPTVIWTGGSLFRQKRRNEERARQSTDLG